MEQEPRNRINRRKILRTELENDLKKTNQILEDQIDNLMAIFAEDDPFYIVYTSARTLVHAQTIPNKEPEEQVGSDSEETEE